MIPYVSIGRRIIAWLLFKLNGWTLDDEWSIEVLEHPEVSTMASICRDYWYAKRWERDAS